MEEVRSIYYTTPCVHCTPCYLYQMVAHNAERKRGFNLIESVEKAFFHIDAIFKTNFFYSYTTNVHNISCDTIYYKNQAVPLA